MVNVFGEITQYMNNYAWNWNFLSNRHRGEKSRNITLKNLLLKIIKNISSSKFVHTVGRVKL